MTRESRQQQDMVFLTGRPEFHRLLFRIIEEAGIFRSASGSEERTLQAVEGRRSLGLDILRWADEALPLDAHPSGIPIIALMSALREEAQPQEEPSVGRSSNSTGKPARRGNRDSGDRDDGDDFARR